MIFFILFAAMVPLANWLIGNVGTVCVPDGPCLIPVAPGLAPELMAPSGVLAIGAALVFRDLVQRRLGVAWAVGAIALGAAISAAIAPPALVVASTVAFLLSELADLGVYTPLQKRGLALAVLASGVVGALIDSAVFLQLAFGSQEFLLGQFVGKLWAAIVAVPLILLLRRREANVG